MVIISDYSDKGVEKVMLIKEVILKTVAVGLQLDIGGRDIRLHSNVKIKVSDLFSLNK